MNQQKKRAFSCLEIITNFHLVEHRQFSDIWEDRWTLNDLDLFRIENTDSQAELMDVATSHNSALQTKAPFNT